MFKEILIQELISEIGLDLFNQNNEFIQRYFTICPEKYESIAIDLTVTKDDNDEYAIYEADRGTLLNRIVKDLKNDQYIVQPCGLARLLANDIMGQFNMLDNPVEFSQSVYQTLFYSHELPHPESMDDFLYHLGVIMIDTLNLSIYDSIVRVEDPKCFMIDGVKDEIVESTMNYETVSYIITVVMPTASVSALKMYADEVHDVFLSMNVCDIIIKSYNEYIDQRRTI